MTTRCLTTHCLTMLGLIAIAATGSSSVCAAQFLSENTTPQYAVTQNREVTQQPDPTRLQLPDAIVTSQTSFEIPFNTDDRDGRLIEVQLYVSTDLGRTWSLYSRQSPQVKKIPFESVGDGEYLFALKTLDRDRQLLPSGPPIPTLRIAIDTNKPDLQMRIDPDKDGRVSATWRAADSNLDPRSLHLSYRIAETGASADWMPVPTGTSSTDQRQADRNVHQDRVVWWPDTNANAIVIKAEIKDHAGNIATVVQPVGLSAFRHTAQSAPSFATADLTPPNPDLVGQKAVSAYKPNASNAPRPTSGPIAWPADNDSSPMNRVGNLAYDAPKSSWANPEDDLAGTFAAAIQGTPNNESAIDAKTRDAAALGNMTVAEGSTLQQNELGPQQPTLANRSSEFIPQSALAQTGIRNNKPSNNFGQQSRAATEPNTTSLNAAQNPESGVRSNFISHSKPLDEKSPTENTFDTERASARNQFSQPGNSNVPTTQNSNFQFQPGTYFVVNQKQFRLRYHVDGLVPDQIGSVAIFGSTDMGQSWRLWTTDQDKTSPVSIEVPDQGRYAFRVVVTNLGGLASDIPKNGTPPELVVDIDLTSPTPRIVAAPYGKDPSAAALMIQWTCSDQDLTDSPIAIAYSHSARGPWTTIVKDAPNTGTYRWLLHPNLPKQVFLRMSASDKAGNKGFHQLPDAINLAPLIPHGRILGLEK